MINNYKYPIYYPEPEPLRDQYRYAVERLELDMPLPGYSVKVPFVQKPTRFLTVNRKKKQIDYLKSHIQNRVDLEELHYQAKIEQMKRQNQYNRERLQRLLLQQPRHLFEIPDKITDESHSISSQLERLSLQNLRKKKQRYMDSIDEVRIQSQRGRKNSGVQEQNLSPSEEQNQEKKKEEIEKRNRQLDYIYKRKGAINNENHFGTTPVLKNEQQKKVEKEKQKKQEYNWVQKVRQAKKFVEDDKSSVDSSQPSQKSDQKKQKSQKVSQYNQPARYSNQNSRIDNPKMEGNKKLIQNSRNRAKTPEKISQKTVSNYEDISDLSQFSRYAKKKDINKEMNKKKKVDEAEYQAKLRNIFEKNESEEEQQEAEPKAPSRKRKRVERGNWKV